MTEVDIIKAHIKECKERIVSIRQGMQNPGKYLDVEGCKENILILNTIIQILEKQIPKKVKGKSLTHEGHVGNCPRCGKFITNFKNGQYCSCEQKLEW